MKLVNCTSHTINLLDGTLTVLSPATESAFVQTRTVEVPIEDSQHVNGLPIITRLFGTISGVPDPEPDTLYIVPTIVALMSDRTDLVVPQTTYVNNKIYTTALAYVIDDGGNHEETKLSQGIRSVPFETGTEKEPGKA